jgi:hypothetical protein
MSSSKEVCKNTFGDTNCSNSQDLDEIENAGDNLSTHAYQLMRLVSKSYNTNEN